VSVPLATVFLQTTNFIDACYIVAFGLMIYGMSGLTGPRTAVRGNQIAAAGMAVAVVATLLRQGEFHGSSTVWLIIVLVAVFQSFATGYSLRRKFWFSLVMTPLVVAVVMALLADLDNPHGGLIRIQQTSLERLSNDDPPH